MVAQDRPSRLNKPRKASAVAHLVERKTHSVLEVHIRAGVILNRPPNLVQVMT
jgi:hypothetical protein